MVTNFDSKSSILGEKFNFCEKNQFLSNCSILITEVQFWLKKSFLAAKNSLVNKISISGKENQFWYKKSIL